MERPCLNDKEEHPSEEVLHRVLGRTKRTWDAFMAMVAEHHPSFSGEWRYYNDGKSWLYKLTNKKKTVCWVSVWPKAFKIAFYFPDKAEELVTAGKLEAPYVDQFIHGKKYGKIRGIVVTLTKAADLDAVKTLIEIKGQVR
jgi:hypothetical protein